MTEANTILIGNRWGQSPPDGFRTLVTDRYKLSVCTTGEGELYDLQHDPQELDNRFNRADAASVQSQLTQRMLVACLRDDDPLPRREACW